jgi:hypothetical protein
MVRKTVARKTRKVKRGLNYKETPKYKSWIRKIGEATLTPKSKRQDDLCATASTICKGNMGINREFMPQLDIKTFTKTLTDKYKVTVEYDNILPSELKASQGEIRETTVRGIIKTMKNGKFNSTDRIVVSHDNYVVDGHHRWAASLLYKPKRPIPVLRINSNIKDVLGMAAAEGAKTIMFGGAFANHTETLRAPT